MQILIQLHSAPLLWLVMQIFVVYTFFAASQTPSIIRAAIGIQWLAHILIIPKDFGVSFSIFMLSADIPPYLLGNVKLCFNVIYSIFHHTLWGYILRWGYIYSNFHHTLHLHLTCGDFLLHLPERGEESLLSCRWSVVVFLLGHILVDILVRILLDVLVHHLRDALILKKR